MTFRETVTKRFRGLFLLAVPAAAVMLLPLVPVWARQSVPATTQPQTGVVAQQRQGKDLDKSRQDLEKAAADLADLQRVLKLLQDQVKAKEQSLKKAQQELKQAEKAVAQKKTVTPPSPAGGKDSVDKRLAELEKKLDMVLQEVRDIRRSMGKGKEPANTFIELKDFMIRKDEKQIKDLLKDVLKIKKSDDTSGVPRSGIILIDPTGAYMGTIGIDKRVIVDSDGKVMRLLVDPPAANPGNANIEKRMIIVDPTKKGPDGPESR